MRLLALFATGACVALSGASALPQRYRSQVTLWLQEAAFVSPEVSVRFIGFSDDRCPSNQRCAKPGDVMAWLEVTPDTGPRRYVTLQLPPGLDSQFAATALGLRFCFVALEPYPGSEPKVNAAAHQIRFAIGAESQFAECK